jgi:hypothetical protein
MAREGHLHQEHAAAAVARLTGCPGGAAGPGVTNTITAVKNAQLAQSPIVLIGGAAPTGRCRPGTDGGKHCAGPIVCCSPVFRLTSASTRRSAVSYGPAFVAAGGLFTPVRAWLTSGDQPIICIPHRGPPLAGWGRGRFRVPQVFGTSVRPAQG